MKIFKCLLCIVLLCVKCFSQEFSKELTTLNPNDILSLLKSPQDASISSQIVNSAFQLKRIDLVTEIFKDRHLLTGASFTENMYINPITEFKSRVILMMLQEPWPSEDIISDKNWQEGERNNGPPHFQAICIHTLSHYLPEEKLTQDKTSIIRLSYFEERQKLAAKFKEVLDKEAAEKGLPPTPPLLHPITSNSPSSPTAPDPLPKPQNKDPQSSPTSGQKEESLLPWVCAGVFALAVLLFVYLKRAKTSS